MFVGLIFVVVGIVMVIWAGWLTPRWLRNVQSKMPPDRQSHFAGVSKQTLKYLAAADVCGGLMFLTGIALLLSR
jgi:hypothetical protein